MNFVLNFSARSLYKHYDRLLKMSNKKFGQSVLNRYISLTTCECGVQNKGEITIAALLKSTETFLQSMYRYPSAANFNCSCFSIFN
jgi:type IV secretory pathway component VirB8